MDLNPIITAFISVGLGIYITKLAFMDSNKLEMKKKQLHNIYLPLFTFIEPYLSNPPNNNTLTILIGKIETIKNEHYELIPPELLLRLDALKKSIDSDYQNEYKKIFRHIEITFDNLRASCFMPTRSIKYRVHLNSTSYIVAANDWLREKVYKFSNILLIIACSIFSFGCLRLILILFSSIQSDPSICTNQQYLSYYFYYH